MATSKASTRARDAVFVTTQWSVVLTAAGSDTAQAQAALEKLCATYWYPLYAYVRRRGHPVHDAQDLTQTFLARLLERKWVGDADRERGRFRTFLPPPQFAPAQPLTARTAQSARPWTIWFAVITLGATILLQLVAVPLNLKAAAALNNPGLNPLAAEILAGAIFNGVMIAGLLMRAKWAYLIITPASAFGFFSVLVHNYAPFAPIWNVVNLALATAVIVPVLMSTSWFFPPEHPKRRFCLVAMAVAAALAVLFGILLPLPGFPIDGASGPLGQKLAQWLKSMSTVNVRGSGTPGTEIRDVGEFSKIKIEGSPDLDVVIGSNTLVTITADDNLLPLIETGIDGGSLRIRSTKSYNSRLGVKIHVTTPSLDAIATSGSGSVFVSGLVARAFGLTISGSSDAMLKGTADNFDLSIFGSGDVQAGQLIAKDVNITISGSGDAVVHATESLNASVAGSGDVTYLGNPEHVQRNIAGSGTIHSR